MQSLAVRGLPFAPKLGCKRQLPPWGWCWAEGAKLSSQNKGSRFAPPNPKCCLCQRAPWAKLWLVDPLQRATPKCSGDVPTSAVSSCRS